MSSEKPKQVNLTEYDLVKIKETAHTKFINKAPNPRMDGSSFIAFCWTDSVIEYLNREHNTNLVVKLGVPGWDGESLDDY